MNNSDKYYIKNLIKDTLNIFKKEGYLKGSELNKYILETLKLEKRDKEYLLDSIVYMFLETDPYKQIENNEVRKCPMCKKILPNLDFYKRLSECKCCRNEIRKKYRKNNKDKKKIYNTDYYRKICNDQEKYEKYLARKRTNRNTNKEKYQAASRKSKLKRYLIDVLEREITSTELEEAFILKENEKIKNSKVYEIMFQ